MTTAIKQEQTQVLVNHGFPLTVIEPMRELTEFKLTLLKKISIGPTLGTKFIPRIWTNILLPLGIALIDHCGAKNIRIWFDRFDGYQHLAFDLSANHYEIKFWKGAYIVVKNHHDFHESTKSFDSPDGVLNFFCDYRYATWDISHLDLRPINLAKIMIAERRSLASKFFEDAVDLECPHIWESKGAYYIGNTKQNGSVVWKINIIKYGHEYRAIYCGNRSIAQSGQFPSIIQYALLEWDWLNA